MIVGRIGSGMVVGNEMGWLVSGKDAGETKRTLRRWRLLLSMILSL